MLYSRQMSAITLTIPDELAERLTPQEEELWERYEFLEHLVRLAKTKACIKLGIPSRSDA
jgi:hypothetical protein